MSYFYKRQVTCLVVNLLLLRLLLLTPQAVLVAAWLTAATTTTTTTARKRTRTRTSTSSASAASSASIVDVEQHLRILDESFKRANVNNNNSNSNNNTMSLCQAMGIDKDNNESNQNTIPWTGLVHTATRFALISHGNESAILDGPVVNYANFAALASFQVTAAALQQIPASRLVPAGVQQDEWMRDMRKLRLRQRQGGNDMIHKYSGMRWTVATQQVFCIQDAMIWNCYDDEGNYYGQATLWDRRKMEMV